VPYFSILLLSSLHLMIFKHPYITLIQSPIIEIFSAMNSALCYLPIYCLDFHLKKKSCLQTLKRFYGITSFPRYPLLEIIFYENQDGLCFLWDLGFWILTIQPSHSYTLAYFRPIHLNLLNFKTLKILNWKH
jgi:hypothetical protein